MSAAEQIDWWSEHPAYLRSVHPCEDLGDEYDTDFPNPANDNGHRLVALATSFPEQPNGAAISDHLSHLPLARGATASTRQGRGGLFRSEARTETGRGLTPIKEAKDDGGNSSFTVYVFESLELRRTQYDSTFADDGSGTDYQINHYTVVPYLLANGVRMARLVYHAPEAVPEEDYQPHGAPGDVNGFTPQAPAVTEGKLHVFFELGDHLGSTSVVLDKATGELVERATFQGYGGAESDYRPDRWKSFREDYRFTGKEEDVEVGLQYFGFRYLNPLLGRWVSTDPIEVHAVGEADANVYAYVEGEVLRAIDPLGLQAHSDAGKPARPTGGDGNLDFRSDRPGQPGQAGNGSGRANSQPAPNSGDGNSYNGDPTGNKSGGDGNSYSGQPDPNASDNGSTQGTPAEGEGQAADSTPNGKKEGSGKKGNGKGEWDAGGDLAALSGLGDDDLDSNSPNATTKGNVGGKGDGSGTKLGQLAYSLGQLLQKGGSNVLKGLKHFGGGVRWAAEKSGQGLKKAWNALRSIFSKCFAAGTLVELESGLVRIEDVRLGARVAESAEGCAGLPLGGWVRLDFEMRRADGDFVGTAALLRPDPLVEGVVAGTVLELAFEELPDVQSAIVVSVTYAQEIEVGQGCPITGYFQSLSQDMATVVFEDEAEPLRATGGHRLYSLSRDDWVGAAHLEPGEWVESNEGPKLVESVQYDPFASEPVYNLEIASLHEYRVGECGIRAHNGGPCPKGAGKTTSKIDRAAFKAEREAYWKAEAENNAGKYSAEDLARMHKGRAPIGPDGHPMELHHVNRTPEGGLRPMSRTEHRLGENYKKNHPE